MDNKNDHLALGLNPNTKTLAIHVHRTLHVQKLHGFNAKLCPFKVGFFTDCDLLNVV